MLLEAKAAGYHSESVAVLATLVSGSVEEVESTATKELKSTSSAVAA